MKTLHSLFSTVIVLLVFCFAGALSASAQTESKQVRPVRILLVGDSTVTDSAGWGKAFGELLTAGATSTNAALGGSSTKSFMGKDRWTKALAVKPTHVLIQFGHNDMPGKGPERETDPKTTYRTNLCKYIDDSRAAGAIPILVTSLTRRNFDKDGKLVDLLADYAAAVRIVAAEKKVPLVDLHARSIESVMKLGPTGSAPLGPLDKDGKRDNTHLSPEGATLTAKLVADELRKAVPELAAFIKN